MPRQTTTHVDSAAGVAGRLRQAREAAGLTQTQLSFPGCSVGYISRIEAAARIPSLQVIRELARRTGVSEAWLATGAEAEPGPSALLRDAELALRMGELDEAEHLYRDTAAGRESAREVALATAGLGQIAFRRDDLSAAIALFEEALATDPELWDQSALDSLGRAYFRSGEREAAIALFRRCLARAEAESDPAGRLRFAVLLANALVDVAAFSEATLLLAGILKDLDGGDPLALARVHWTQARLHTQQHEHEAASRHARRALEILDVTEHTYYRACAHHTLGFAELDAGKPEQALEILETGLALLGDLGTPHDHAMFHLEIARALALLGRGEEAAGLAMRTAAEYSTGMQANIGRSFATVAGVLAEQGDEPRALELYELAIELLADPPSRYLVEALARYGALLEQAGHRDRAFEAYKRATTLQADLERGRTARG